MRRFLIPPGLLPNQAQSASTAAASATSTVSSSLTGKKPSHALAEEEKEEERDAKRARTSVSVSVSSSIASSSSSSTAAARLFPAPMWAHSEHVNLLTQEQRRLAQSCRVGEWVSLGGALVRLHTHTLAGPVRGVVSFDMDGTLIKTKSGARFPQGAEDWKFWDASVPLRLRELHEQGYLLAILSNQAGIAQKKQDADEIKRKVESILAQLEVPVDFICATESYNVFRKPCTGMWDFLSIARWDALITESTSSSAAASSAQPHEAIDRIYVGDAAGRAKDGSRAKDHSDADLKLAVNLGVTFATPEHFFLGSTQRLHTHFTANIPGSVRLTDWAKTASPSTQVSASSSVTTSLGDSAKEIVLLVAPAASGKSTFARKMAQDGYMRINQDELKTIAACLRKAKEVLSVENDNCRGVFVDNTNLSIDTRRNWIALAKELNVPIRCVVVNTPKEVCMTLAALRLVDPNTAAQDRRKIETVVLHKHFKDLSLSPPTTREGFSSIENVSFSLSLPDKDVHPITFRLLHMYLK